MSAQGGVFVGHSLPTGVERMPGTVPFVPGIPLRLEIGSYFPNDQVSEDPKIQKQWTLFVLGLERFMALPVDKTYSYFQIAGIHGFPSLPWADCPKGGFYCHHGEIDFSTWHRPYLLLFEQQIIINMKDVIKDWNLPQSEAEYWTTAADEWRFPYWDWAAKQALPFCFTVQDVPIFPPSGKGLDKTHKNPLWRFENPEKGADKKALPFGKMPPGKEKYNIADDSIGGASLPWSQCTGTSRYGVTKGADGVYGGLEGVNNFSLANGVLKNYKMPAPPDDPQDPDWHVPAPLQDAVDRMLSKGYHKTWGTFASTKWRGDNAEGVTQYLSLEQIHNKLHLITGGYQYTGPSAVGHMCSVPVAAFDPIFWLHHCNIDRLLASFQVLNPQLWWDTKEPAPNPPPVDPIIPDPAPTIPLYPFRHPQGPEGYWSSDLAKDWTTLGYSYDKLVPRKALINSDGTLNEAQYQAELRIQLHQKYAATPKLAQKVFKNKNLANDTFLGYSDGRWNDYVVNILYDRHALNGRAYAITFYLDSPSQVVGQIYSFTGLPLEAELAGIGCKNCTAQKDARVLHKAQISVTIPIINRAKNVGYSAVNSVDPDEVTTYLQSNLKWQFIASGGDELPQSDFPATKISIWGGVGRPYSLSEDLIAPGIDADDVPDLTHYEEYTKLYDAL